MRWILQNGCVQKRSLQHRHEGVRGFRFAISTKPQSVNVQPLKPFQPMNASLTRYWPVGTVYGILLNFQRERDLLAAQMAQAPYKAPPNAPVLYVKTANTWSASGASVPVPHTAPQIEVGATIGMTIGAPSALAAGTAPVQRVASYVLMNDFSIPHASFFRPPVKFKCLDGFLGIGAQVVNTDLAGDPALFKLEVRINGELKQAIDFSQTVRSAAQLLADVSEFMTLREGDVLLLGCDCLPGGGRPLAQAGDQIDISSPSHPALGRLTSTLVKEAT